MSKIKHIITWLTSLAIVAGLAAVPAAAATPAEASKALQELQQLGVYSNTKADDLARQTSVTRRAFAISAVDVLVEDAASQVANEGASDTCKGLRTGAAGYAQLQLAAKYGLISSCASTSLGENITFAEAVGRLVDMLDLPSPAQRRNFTDVPATAQYHDQLMIAVDQGLISPRTGQRLGASRVYDMREHVYLLSRLVQVMQSMNGEDGAPTIHIGTPIINIDLSERPAMSPLLDAVYQSLDKQSLYRDDFKGNEAMTQAIKALVDSLGDDYAEFFSAEENMAYTEALEGNFQGIGAFLNVLDNGDVVINDLVDGAPAKTAGLQRGDIITAVNGTQVRGQNTQVIIPMIRGAAGTQVSITVLRGSTSVTVTVTRAAVSVPNVKSTLDNGLLTIKLFQFSDAVDVMIINEIAKYRRDDVKAIALDLRGDPGGLLTSAVAITQLFVAEGNVVTTIAYPDYNEVLKTGTSSRLSAADAQWLRSVPLAVLVDKGSASASEIVAGALQDYKRAVLVGSTTYGKGLVQELRSFTDGSSLKFTVAKWLTPNGRYINKKGITPDIVADDVQTTPLDETVVAARKALNLQ